MKKIVLFLLLASACLSALTTLQVPAVDSSGNGMITTFEARVVPGHGGVFMDVYPYISVDTQESARTAVRVAAAKAGVDYLKYDMLYTIIADAEIVDGPSGGAALVLLAYAEFVGEAPRGDLATTGTIERDGSIGKVSGVANKLDAVNRAGLKLFIVPAGQSKQGGVDLAALAWSEFGLQVVEARSLNELVDYAYSPEGSMVNASLFIVPPLIVRAIEPSSAVELMKGIVIQTQDALEADLVDLDSEVLVEEVESALNDSRYLLEQGYYYSAANTAFLTRVGVDAFELAASNITKPEFELMLDDLEDELNAFQAAPKTAENWEWVAGAEARREWARMKLSDLRDAFTLKKVTSMAEDYASAVNWLKAANDFNNAAKSIGGIEFDEFLVRNLAEESLADANAVGDTLPAGVDSEIDWHLDAAREEFSNGEYLASVFDSCFVTSFDKAEGFVTGAIGEDFGVLSPDYDSFEEIKGSLWPELYYSHALYDVQEANRTGEFAYSMTAVKLRVLAECLKLKGKGVAITITLEPASPSPKPSLFVVAATVSSKPLDWGKWLGLGALAAAIIAAALILIALRSHYSTSKPLSNEERLHRLDDLLLRGRLSERTYERLRKKYKGVKPTKMVKRKRLKR
jgi:hypothetical protein